MEDKYFTILWLFLPHVSMSPPQVYMCPLHSEKVSAAQSCPTRCDPVDCSPPGSPVRGILQQEHWIAMEWIAMLSSEIHHASHQKYLISFCRFRKCLFFLTSALRVVPHKSCTFQSSRHQMPTPHPRPRNSVMFFLLCLAFLCSPPSWSLLRGVLPVVPDAGAAQLHQGSY